MSDWIHRPKNVGIRQHVENMFKAQDNYIGYTVEEVRNMTGYHHGQASGSLSILNQKGVLSLLEDRRGDYRIYVLKGREAGRTVVPRRGAES